MPTTARHFGYVEQPQNCWPSYRPLPAVRSTMVELQRGQMRASAVKCPRQYCRIGLDADGSLSGKQASPSFAPEEPDANPALAPRRPVMAIAVVLVWALVLGISPGLALIAIPVTALAVDRYDPVIIDRLSSRWTA